MPAPTTVATTKTAPDLALDARLALVGAEMDGRLAWASADINIRTAHIETPNVPLSPTPQPEPTTDGPIAQLLRTARALIAAGWCTGRYDNGRGARCLQGALAAADTNGHAAQASHLLLEAISRDGNAEGIANWNDRQINIGPVLRALDQAIRIAQHRGV